MTTLDRSSWPTLVETMGRIAENPAYVLGLTPLWRADPPPGTPFHNLPAPEFDETGFFGRREELAKLKRLIKGNYPVVSVLGTGGIGKTALTIRAAYDLLDDPDRRFDAIVWVTAKSSVLTSREILSITDAVKDSLGLFSSAAAFLGSTDEDDPIEDLKSYLEAFKVLLILDNLETVLDASLREFLSDIPLGSKVIVTSRISLGMLDNPIHLGPLNDDEAVNLLYALCRARGVASLQGLARADIALFAGKMSGHPAYIRWFVAGLQSGRRPEELLGDNELLLEYCMSNVYEYLDDDARDVLGVFQVLTGARNMAEIAHLAGLSGHDAERLLLTLLTTNFVSMSSRTQAATLDTNYFLTDFAKEYLDRKHPVAKPRRGEILRRSQELRDHGATLTGEMAATPYSEDTVTIRGAEDASVAKILKSALAVGPEDGGLGMCQEAQHLSPYYSETYRVEGTLRVRMHDDSAAIERFDRALALSDFPSTRYHYATFLLGDGLDIRRALSLLQEAARMDRESPEIAGQIAWAQYLLREWSLAFAAAKLVLELPRSTFGLQSAALIVALRASCQRVEHDFGRERPDSALEAVEEALELCETYGPDLLAGEPADLLLLMRSHLEASASRLSRYFARVAVQSRVRMDQLVATVNPGPMRILGPVARVVADRGFGFVAASPQDYFLHVSEFINKEEWEDLIAGDVCCFEPEQSASGWRARAVRVLRL